MVTTDVRVLVVEDDADLRDVLGTYLRWEGFDVATCDGPDSARRLLDAGDVDVVVIDRHLDGASGWDFTDEVRRERPGIECIRMTGAIGATGDGRELHKPFRMAALAGMVHCITSGKGGSGSCRCSPHDDFVPSAG